MPDLLSFDLGPHSGQLGCLQPYITSLWEVGADEERRVTVRDDRDEINKMGERGRREVRANKADKKGGAKTYVICYI